MTLELFSIFINAVVKSIEAADEAQHVLAVVFIAFVLGVGIWWTLMTVSASFAKNIF